MDHGSSKSTNKLSLIATKSYVVVLFLCLFGSVVCWILYSSLTLSAPPCIQSITTQLTTSTALFTFVYNFTLCQQKVASMKIGDKDFETIHFLPNDRRRFIARLLCTAPNSKYLEWGSGGSTELISVFPNGIQKAYSIENAVPWCERMLKIEVVANAIKLQRLVFKCVDTGQPLQSWGSPQKGANISAMQIYIDMIDNLPETHFDIVLIDGRFRVACAMKLLMGNYVDDTSIVMIDDYYNRLQYSIVEKYYKILDTHQVIHGKGKENLVTSSRMVTLKKRELDASMQKQLLKDFDKYKLLP